MAIAIFTYTYMHIVHQLYPLPPPISLADIRKLFTFPNIWKLAPSIAVHHFLNEILEHSQYSMHVGHIFIHKLSWVVVNKLVPKTQQFLWSSNQLHELEKTFFALECKDTNYCCIACIQIYMHLWKIYVQDFH